MELDLEILLLISFVLKKKLIINFINLCSTTK